MPWLFPTPDLGLRVLSCSEWVAPPLEERGLAFIQDRLRSGKHSRIGVGRDLGSTRLMHTPPSPRSWSHLLKPQPLTVYAFNPVLCGILPSNHRNPGLQLCPKIPKYTGLGFLQGKEGEFPPHSLKTKQ